MSCLYFLLKAELLENLVLRKIKMIGRRFGGQRLIHDQIKRRKGKGHGINEKSMTTAHHFHASR